MGLDYSLHAVDTALFRDRIGPFLLDNQPIDDLIDRAALIAAARHRASSWSLAVLQVTFDVSNAQFRLADGRARKEVVEARGPQPGFFARLFGAKPPTIKEERAILEEFPRFPGFDSDREVWGRPFFIVGDDSDRALADLDRYLEAAPLGQTAIDAIAHDMLARLEHARLNTPLRGAPDMVAIVRDLAPLTSITPRLEDSGPFDAAAFKAGLVERAAMWRAAVHATHPDAIIVEGRNDKNVYREPLQARDAQIGLPLELMSFAAMLLPGWMGRGWNHPTSLLDRIGVRRSHLFEAPAALFGPLLKHAPAVREALHDAIPENFSLGGYVPPEKVEAFIALLEANRDALILAWHEDRATLTREKIDELDGDYLKILEPARYAQRHGYGFVEAAEIYSGFLGMMN